MLLPAPSARARAALWLAADGLTDEAIAARLGVAVRTARRDLEEMREFLGNAPDRTSAAYRLGTIVGSPRRRRRVRDDEPTLPW